MSDFIIPNGGDYAFTVRVFQENTFVPQDVTGSTATFKLFDIATQCVKASVVMSSTTDPINGILTGTILNSDTLTLVPQRGDKEDGYYLKPAYQATILITGLPNSAVDVSVTIDKIYVTPSAGVDCVE